MAKLLRDKWAERLKLTPSQRRNLTPWVIDQLKHAKDNAARRLLTGKGREGRKLVKRNIVR
jgi:hypothetical protein